MTRVMARTAGANYRATMVHLIGRLVVLMAVLLMPFGMANAGATHSMHAVAQMPMHHSPISHSSLDPAAGLGECTMACSAALPAIDRSYDPPQHPAAAPAEAALVASLQGIVPQTATPPPKHS